MAHFLSSHLRVEEKYLFECVIVETCPFCNFIKNLAKPPNLPSLVLKTPSPLFFFELMLLNIAVVHRQFWAMHHLSISKILMPPL